MKIIAKFKCDKVEETLAGESVTLRPVYAAEGPNKQWSQWTPAGQLDMTISNPAAKGYFAQGKEYMLQITEAEPDGGGVRDDGGDGG